MKQLPQQFTEYTRQVLGRERYAQFIKGMDEPCPNSIRINSAKVIHNSQFIIHNSQCIIHNCCCAGDVLANNSANCCCDSAAPANNYANCCCDSAAPANNYANCCCDSAAPANNYELCIMHYELSQVPWCKNGYYLAERPEYTLDPLFHAGCYYVQEASSMFLDKVLRQYVDSPVRMLDMCAAPGGKTTTAMGALPEGSIVMSNEPVRLRANILAENVQKWGNHLNIVSNNYPKDYAESGLMFDVILCDVPCSGEGMFRKDDGAISEWNVANVEKCWQLQREIVADAWKCLRPGGLLVYSTCTFNTRENEENVRWICENLCAEMLSVDTSDDWNITGSLLNGFDGSVYRFIPGISRGEGLFMAVMRKSDDAEMHNRKIKTDKLQTERFPHQWLRNQFDYNIYKKGERFVAIHSSMNDLYAIACRSLNIVHAGVTLGEQKRNDIIPQQSLALSTQLDATAFPTAELSYTNAIAYLRRESIVLDASVPRGFVVVTFNGHPLGFVKNLGNRANNLYPQEWRIRKTLV